MSRRLSARHATAVSRARSPSTPRVTGKRSSTSRPLSGTASSNRTSGSAPTTTGSTLSDLISAGAPRVAPRRSLQPEGVAVRHGPEGRADARSRLVDAREEVAAGRGVEVLAGAVAPADALVVGLAGDADRAPLDAVRRFGEQEEVARGRHPLHVVDDAVAVDRVGPERLDAGVRRRELPVLQQRPDGDDGVAPGVEPEFGCDQAGGAGGAVDGDRREGVVPVEVGLVGDHVSVPDGKLVVAVAFLDEVIEIEDVDPVRVGDIQPAG